MAFGCKFSRSYAAGRGRPTQHASIDTAASLDACCALLHRQGLLCLLWLLPLALSGSGSLAQGHHQILQGKTARQDQVCLFLRRRRRVDARWASVFRRACMTGREGKRACCACRHRSQVGASHAPIQDRHIHARTSRWRASMPCLKGCNNPPRTPPSSHTAQHHLDSVASPFMLAVAPAVIQRLVSTRLCRCLSALLAPLDRHQGRGCSHLRMAAGGGAQQSDQRRRCGPLRPPGQGRNGRSASAPELQPAGYPGCRWTAGQPAAGQPAPAGAGQRETAGPRCAQGRPAGSLPGTGRSHRRRSGGPTGRGWCQPWRPDFF